MQKLWPNYVVNRSFTLSVKNMTAKEELSGTSPPVQHFRVFGCVAHAHVHDTQRNILDVKSVQCVNLGVIEKSKSYKLYVPVKGKVIIRIDVMFEES